MKELPEQGDYSREALIAICAAAIVPVKEWRDRDTPEAQEKVGQCWAYLRAGCTFRVLLKPAYGSDNCVTDEGTIWLEVTHPTFTTFELDLEDDTETFYLPTPSRLRAKQGRDWY